jgi:UDP-N-acetylglucosamine--N-acetylmuramyl-(pentapeptide) pyrophosphoryl-undecaprenol N-acetylglucosamine transferase
VINDEKMAKGQKLKIIISGGGTGGHLFPAIAIAKTLQAIDSEVEILFVGAESRMEMEKVPEAGYQIIGLPIEGFNRKNLFKNFAVLVKIAKSLNKARKILKEFNPTAAIGVGGFASGPLLWAASQMHIPVYIQEQNSYAGITNKLLAKKARLIFVAYQNMDRFFPAQKIRLTGNPVRSDIYQNTKDKKEALEYFGLSNTKKTILCLGGSLGARSLNESIAYHLQWFYQQKDYQLIWQCGRIYHEKYKAIVETGRNVVLLDFISNMEMAYAAADLIISRSGAGTISELCLVGKPVILVPSPNVAEDHQTKNARELVNSNAAIMIPDNEAKEKLLSEAVSLLVDSEKCNKLASNIKKLAIPNAAENIANAILEDLKLYKS